MVKVEVCYQDKVYRGAIDGVIGREASGASVTGVNTGVEEDREPAEGQQVAGAANLAARAKGGKGECLGKR